MKQSRIILIGLLMALTAGCAGRAIDDPARKEIRAPKSPPPVPRAVAEPIDSDLRAKARSQMNDALGSNEEVLRANAIEALQESVGVDARKEIVAKLEDAHPLVRFAATMACGTLQLPEAKPTLDDLASDANPSVRVAARYALHRLGDTHLSHDLEKMAIDPDRAVRGNTALVLGLLGEKSALVILRTMIHDREPAVRIQVAEALWKLGDESGLENLMAASLSSAPDDQIIAMQALAAPKDQRVSGLIYGNLVADYPEVSLAAARAMGVLGSDAGYTVAMNATKSRSPRERSLAALALGAIGRSDAQTALARLLDDSDVNVRLAAATAILQLKPPSQK